MPWLRVGSMRAVAVEAMWVDVSCMGPTELAGNMKCAPGFAGSDYPLSGRINDKTPMPGG
jgi:hypothetical protein